MEEVTEQKIQRRGRKTSPRSASIRTLPAASARLKELWADPTWREELIAKRKLRIQELKKTNPHLNSRAGVPDGMRKPEALKQWALAREQARKFIKIMEDNGELDVFVIPGTEAEMAKKALEEAYTMAVGPMGDAKTKASAIRTVLEWTKAKPESKSKLTLDKSEEFLAILNADMKSDAGGAE